MKKTISLLLCLLLAVSLLGCAAKSAAPQEAAKTDSYAFDRNEELEYFGWEEAESPAMEPEFESYTGGFGADNAAEKGGMIAEEEISSDVSALGTDKIIYSASVNLETTEFDGAVEELKQLAAELGGYVESSSVSGDTVHDETGATTVVNRFAYFTICVPSKEFQNALSRAAAVGSVTNQRSWMENVESQYTDLETRIESLTIQRDWLMDMMEKSEDVSSLIELEARLSEVVYEMESLTRSLKNLDRRIAFSTIDLTLREVEVYTPTVSVRRTFGEKLRDALSYGWSEFVYGMENLAVWFVGALPTLLLLAVVAAAAVLITVRIRKRRRARKDARKAQAEPEQKQE